MWLINFTLYFRILTSLSDEQSVKILFYFIILKPLPNALSHQPFLIGAHCCEISTSFDLYAANLTQTGGKLTFAAGCSDVR